MHEVYAVKFSAVEIVKHFGGVRATHELLKEHSGSLIGKKTVEKWTERDIMPADAVASLMLAAQRIEVPFDLYNFIKIDGEKFNE